MIELPPIYGRGQRRLNRDHPRLHDLVFAASLNANDALRDLVSGAPLTRTGLSSTVNSGRRLAPLFGGSSYADFTRPAAITEFTPFTLAWTQEPISATSYHTIINVNFGTAGLHNQFVVYQSSSDSAYNFVVGPRGTGGSSAGSPRFDVVGLTTSRQRNRFVLQALAGSQSLSTSSYVLWRDGVRLTTATTAPLGAATAALARIGARDTGADPFEGAIQDMRMWVGILPDAEAFEESQVALADELYEPIRIWVPGSYGGGSGWSVAAVETAAAADTCSATFSPSAAIDETATPSDISTAAIDAVAALVETTSPTDLATAAATLLRAIAEQATPADAATASFSGAGSAAIVETAAPSDSITAAATLLRQVAESTTPNDQAAAAATLVRLITEQAVPVDQATVQGGDAWTVSIEELATAIDVITAAFTGGAAALLSAPPIGHGTDLARRVVAALASRRPNLRSRTR